MTITPEPAAQAPIPQDPVAIQAAIAERQRRLAATVDELNYRLQPKVLARHVADDMQRKAQNAVTRQDGSLRVERIGAVIGVIGAYIALVVWRRRRKRAKHAR
jgi:hypothetical protein